VSSTYHLVLHVLIVKQYAWKMMPSYQFMILVTRIAQSVALKCICVGIVNPDGPVDAVPLSQVDIARELNEIALSLKFHLASPDYATGILGSLSQVIVCDKAQTFKLPGLP
jgi:hypothetical protein